MASKKGEIEKEPEGTIMDHVCYCFTKGHGRSDHATAGPQAKEQYMMTCFGIWDSFFKGGWP